MKQEHVDAIDERLFRELKNCFDTLNSLKVGSEAYAKTYAETTKSIKDLYTLMLNSRKVDIEREKNMADEVLQDRKLDFEKDKTHRDFAMQDRRFDFEKDKTHRDFAMQDRRFDFEKDKTECDFAMRNQQTRNDLIGCYIEGATSLAEVGAKIATIVAAVGMAGAVLKYEETGSVTSKTINWISRLVFR